MELPDQKGLTREEDDTLRRLAWFAETVGVSRWARNRIDDLRARDRRAEIRSPREEVIAVCAADILGRAEIPQARPGLTLEACEPELGGHFPHLGAAGESAELQRLMAVREKKKRRPHPWSLRRNAKAS